jgi:hypothetical protein
MYFLKTKGTQQIPDFIQVRDNEMALIAHFKVERLKENIHNFKIETNAEIVLEMIEKLEYGTLLEIK